MFARFFFVLCLYVCVRVYWLALFATISVRGLRFVLLWSVSCRLQRQEPEQQKKIRSVQGNSRGQARTVNGS